MIRVFFLILFLFNSDIIISQLNPQSKKVTNTFFQDFEEIQNVTPALKKKKGFTNYEELIAFLNKISEKHSDKVQLKYIGESQKGKRIPILYLSDNNNSKNKPCISSGFLHMKENIQITQNFKMFTHKIKNSSQIELSCEK